MFGMIMLIGGISQVVSAFWAGKWSGFLLQVLVGILYVVVGFIVIDAPVGSAASLTLVIAAFLFIGGMVRIVVALVDRFTGWGWVLLNGAVTLLLGLLIYKQWPLSGLFVIGLFVGIEMIFNGWYWVMLALGLKKLPEIQCEESLDIVLCATLVIAVQRESNGEAAGGRASDWVLSAAPLPEPGVIGVQMALTMAHDVARASSSRRTRLSNASRRFARPLARDAVGRDRGVSRLAGTDPCGRRRRAVSGAVGCAGLPPVALARLPACRASVLAGVSPARRARRGVSFSREGTATTSAGWPFPGSQVGNRAMAYEFARSLLQRADGFVQRQKAIRVAMRLGMPFTTSSSAWTTSTASGGKAPRPEEGPPGSAQPPARPVRDCRRQAAGRRRQAVGGRRPGLEAAGWRLQAIDLQPPS